MSGGLGHVYVTHHNDAFSVSTPRNALNQIESLLDSGPTHVKGKASRALSAATVNELPATLVDNDQFEADVQLSAGTHEIVVGATDLGGQDITSKFQIEVGREFIYDSNGNLVDDGEQVYYWDANDRLVRVNNKNPNSSNPLEVFEIRYDGFSRRKEILHKKGFLETTTKRYVWAGNTIAEVKNASNAVARRLFSGGAVDSLSGQSSVYTTDHLGSRREIVDVTGNTLTRFAYDLWGHSTRVDGTTNSDYSYAGLFNDDLPGILGATYRFYSPLAGVWINRDPIGEAGGFNLYQYAKNSVTGYIDPDGESYYSVVLILGGVGFALYKLSGVIDEANERRKKRVEQVAGTDEECIEALSSTNKDGAEMGAKGLSAAGRMPGTSVNPIRVGAK